MASLSSPIRHTLRNLSLRSSVSFKPIPISVNFKLLSVRTMSGASKSKPDDEWRAILTPEQVCLSHQYRNEKTTTTHIYSSECFVRKAPNVLGRESTNTTRPQGCTPAQLATPHSTKAIPSLIAAVVGQPSTMVRRKVS